MLYFLFPEQLNFDRLLAKMWEEMGLVRVYTKPQGQQPDFTDPVVLSTVCDKLIIFFSIHLTCNLCFIFVVTNFMLLNLVLIVNDRIEAGAWLKTSAITYTEI
jgi:hypothetical protein